MGKILLFTVIAAAGFNALLRPWIGIVAYYTLALLGPQYIWWWNFQGLRVSLIIAVCTLIGVGLKLLQGSCDLRYFKTRQNLWLFLLWVCIVISYNFGPFVSSTGLASARLFSITNNIFLFYFCSCLIINDIKHLRYLAFILVVSTLYLTWWANSQYFTALSTGNWSAFNWGRLMGPRSMDGGSIYGDENAFALFFVTGIPFIYYSALAIERKWLRYALYGAIPFAWHAIFLTASRGGLVGLGVVTILIALLGTRKIMVIPLLISFVVFYQWQAGGVMQSRSAYIVNYSEEGSAEGRIGAWKAGLGMIAAHPITGVGLGSFVTAMPMFSDTSPRVAHNTFMQFAAESGIVAGLSYLMAIYLFFRNALRIYGWCRDPANQEHSHWVDTLNNASTVSFAGLAVCALFLSLTTYEILFYLILINNTLSVLCNSSIQQVREGLI
ncbi:MAG: hypothetical protein CVU66_02495 [Deltaproteobacteria bacterium HGW-Deltaproteobacteria-23]|nr:MAG: hypothetical protein CVU66_02495 [Deltaproteobacteria bacterium HGW-Deltaproteobacteria-23]